MAAREVKYWPTQLETFLQCPLKYKCTRDPAIKEKYRKPTPQLYLGSCIHDALEVFFDIRRTPVAARTREKLADLLRRAWAGVDLYAKKRAEREEERRRVFGGDRELEGSWGRQGLHLLDRFFNVTDLKAVPYTAEQFHETKLPSGAILAGKVDRIDKLADGSLKIIDYKTGKPPFRRDDESVAKEDLQLSAYAIVIGKKYGLPVSRCVLVFLGEDQEIGFAPTPALLDEKTRFIEDVVRQVEAEKEFAPAREPPLPVVRVPRDLPGGAEDRAP